MFKVRGPAEKEPLALAQLLSSFEQPRRIKEKMKQGEVKENLSWPLGKIKDFEKGI